MHMFTFIFARGFILFIIVHRNNLNLFSKDTVSTSKIQILNSQQYTVVGYWTLVLHTAHLSVMDHNGEFIFSNTRGQG